MQQRIVTFYLFLAAFSMVLLMSSCSSSGEIVKNRETVENKTESVTNITTSEFLKVLNETRSNLSDVYQTQHHDIPAVFSKTDTSRQVSQNPSDGYRIQILSSTNVALADSLASDFNAWADTTVSGYTPKIYVFFKQPYYKVHVGDFHQYDRANDFSRLIKRKYPDAWVVHDHVDPSLVPADTTMMEIQKGPIH